MAQWPILRVFLRGRWMDTGFILDTGENSLCGDGAQGRLGNTTISTHLIIKPCTRVQKIIPEWIKLGFEGSCCTSQLGKSLLGFN